MDWEELSYMVVVLGFPAAIVSYIYDQAKDRQAQEYELDDALSGEYSDIMDQFIEHPELDKHTTPLNDPDLKQQQLRIYEKLISVFAKAYDRLQRPSDAVEKLVKIFDRAKARLFPGQEGQHWDTWRGRMWNSWQDNIRQWLQAPNFRAALPELFEGEDPEFVAYLLAEVKIIDPGFKMPLEKPVPPLPEPQ